MSYIELYHFDTKEKANIKDIKNINIQCYRYYCKKNKLCYICQIDGFSDKQNSFIENQDGFLYKIQNEFYYILNKGKEMESITKFLEEHMLNIFEEFKQQKWCEINNWKLDTKSYSEIYNQQYYLLKYFPAYFTEYYGIFDSFFKNYDKDSINIISIGCGSGIDFYALEHYKRINNISIEINYKGLDLIDWNYKPDFEFINQNISELDKDIFDDIDLIIFPKILTELTSSLLTELSNKIIESNISKELYFINSYISDNALNPDRVDGINQFEIICNTLHNNDYILENTECNRYMQVKEQHGLRTDFEFFIYPNEIIEYIKNLESNCTHIQEDEEICQNCNISIKSPILRNNFIACNILKFVKNDN